MALNRRDFIKWSAAATILSTGPACSLTPKSELSQSMQRVVIIGGGFGGATAAKYIRMWAKNIEVVLIERNPAFISCPMSNMVLGGNKSINDITVGYAALPANYGVKMLKSEVTAINPQTKTVVYKGGQVAYDRLIIAPGVDFMFNQIEGLTTSEAQEKIPHAWKAGAQTLNLRRQLETMADGGVFVMSIPKAPYRCPPGPYERASQVAYYLKNNKPKSKILILDANPDITSKKGLFTKAWADLYPGMIEYRPNAAVISVNAANKTAKTEFEEIKADVLNVIPPMKAGNAAELAGVINVDNRWCGVDLLSYESKVHKHIHIIGDAVSAALPKSGHMANSQAKVCAAAVIALLQGQEIEQQPAIANTCYSMVSDNEAIHVANVYKYDPTKQLMMAAEGGGVSAQRSTLEGTYAQAWAKNIWADTLL